MSARIEDAAIAVIAAANGTMDTARHDELLYLADTEAIRVTRRQRCRDDRQCRDVAGCHDRSPSRKIYLVRIRRALRAIVLRENRLILVSDNNPYRPQSTIEMWVHERGLSRTLRQFAGRFLPSSRWWSPA